MVEVRNIEAHERHPVRARCVIIEFAGGRFVANGYGAERKSETLWMPPAFDTLEEAIASSIEWATRNSIPIVYVRDTGPRRRLDSSAR